jgi:hypothetical protein
MSLGYFLGKKKYAGISDLHCLPPVRAAKV